MNANKALNQFLGITIIVLGVFIIILKLPSSFPPKGIACVDDSMKEIKDVVKDSYYKNAFEFVPFKNSKITHFKCASGELFSHFEMTGTNIKGQPFYLLSERTDSRAASGAGASRNICYKLNGGTVYNIYQGGSMGDSIPRPGTCTYSDFSNRMAVSEYEFDK